MHWTNHIKILRTEESPFRRHSAQKVASVIATLSLALRKCACWTITGTYTSEQRARYQQWLFMMSMWLLFEALRMYSVSKWYWNHFAKICYQFLQFACTWRWLSLSSGGLWKDPWKGYKDLHFCIAHDSVATNHCQQSRMHPVMSPHNINICVIFCGGTKVSLYSRFWSRKHK